MLSCTEISVVISSSFLRNFGSNLGFHLRNSIEFILKTWKRLILTCFTKIRIQNYATFKGTIVCRGTSKVSKVHKIIGVLLIKI